MTQILVTIEDASVATQLLAAIQKMQGVTHASLYKKETAETEKVVSAKKTYSTRIQRLKGVMRHSGFTMEELEQDERLAQILKVSHNGQCCIPHAQKIHERRGTKYFRRSFGNVSHTFNG